MSTETRYKVGQLVVSCKGHDQGRLYLIVRIEDDFLWLSDGKARPLANAKKKRRKHVRSPYSDRSLISDPEAFLNSRKGSGDGDKAIREFIAASINQASKERA